MSNPHTMYPRFIILLICAICGLQNAYSQCRMVYYPGKVSMAYSSSSHQFYYLNGGDENDSLLIVNYVSLQNVDSTDAVIWDYHHGRLSIARMIKPPKAKKLKLNFSLVQETSDSTTRFINTEITLPNNCTFSHFDSLSVYFWDSTKKEFLQVFFPDFNTPKLNKKYAAQNEVTRHELTSKTITHCNPATYDTSHPFQVFNPYGPIGRLKTQMALQFSRDSALSYPLALLKKSIINKGNSFLWEVKSAEIGIYSDSTLFDMLNTKRQLHQVEFYVEDKFYNETPPRASIGGYYPGLFGSKSVLTSPFYRKNNIRGFLYSWHTLPYLKLQFKPSLVKNTPALLVVRNSRDSHMVGNAIFPETLFMEDSMFLEIYSKPDPVMKTESILGNICIENEQKCNPLFLKSAALEWFLKADCHLDAEIEINGNGDSIVLGNVVPKFKNLIVVYISCTEPKNIGMQRNGDSTWVYKKLFGMYDYPENRIYNASGSFVKETESYNYKVPVNKNCPKSWVLFFSKETVE